MKNLVYLTVLILSDFITFDVDSQPCTIPPVMRKQWFSYENRRSIMTEFQEDSMSGRGLCVDMKRERLVSYSFVFENKERIKCYHCVKITVRTVNVLEKLEIECQTLAPGEQPIVERVCENLKDDQQIETLFAENFLPVNCRSSLEGVWQFAYRYQLNDRGECNDPGAYIRSCQIAGTQFLITNQKFNITYKRCEGMSESFDAVVEYSCLGDWFVDKNHFFAVANTKESRKEEKYRCFLKNRDDDLFIGTSITPECKSLETVESSPMLLRITPVKTETVTPGCKLPQNFSGEWINTANSDAEVTINETHIIETFHPDQDRLRKTIYVCEEQQDSRYMMARLTVDGCQKDYVCFDFVAKHQNIIRFRKGIAMVKNNFHTVCSWVRFPNNIVWKYDLLLAKDPVPVRCPIAGKYTFKQKGEIPFVTRILGGVTLSPRPKIYCKTNISDFSICDAEQKEIWIDENYCLSVDHLGRPVDIYSDPDYKMKCIGFWRENLKSYLITYDKLDAFSSYRCWVYQRSDINKIMISQSLGAFCNINQDITSDNASEGAAVSLELLEYEREMDQCPMLFDDGSNPWQNTDIGIQILDVGNN